MFGKRDVTGRAGKRRVRIHEVTHENDIRYRGPLNFQHFQILGWLCIAISQIAVVLALGGHIDGQITTDTAQWQNILRNIAHLSLPFLLIANFAQILDAENGYKIQLFKNLAAALAVCGVYYLVFYRYIVGGVSAFLEDPRQAMPAVKSVIDQSVPYGFFDFNIFVDLLMCTLTMLFLNYKPRRVFTGKARYLFRLLTLLPIGYEVCCMVLKVRSARGLVEIPVWAYPLMTVKPPMTFVLFVALAVFVKTRELRFRRHGKTHEEYTAFLKTRRNSWGFSVFLAVMLVIVSIVDFAVVIGFSAEEMLHTAMEHSMQAASDQAAGDATAAPGEAVSELAAPEGVAPGETDIEPTLTPEAASAEAAAETLAPQTIPPDGPSEAMTDGERLEASLANAMQDEALISAAERGMEVGFAVGFGESVYMIFLAPVVLLFSYTRKPKYPWIGLFVPVAGICLILLIYLEGTHWLLYRLPSARLSMDELSQIAAIYAEGMQ